MCVIHHVHLWIYLLLLSQLKASKVINESLVVQFSHLIKIFYHPNQVSSVKTAGKFELPATPSQTSQSNGEVGFIQCRVGNELALRQCALPSCLEMLYEECITVKLNCVVFTHPWLKQFDPDQAENSLRLVLRKKAIVGHSMTLVFNEWHCLAQQDVPWKLYTFFIPVFSGKKVWGLSDPATDQTLFSLSSTMKKRRRPSILWPILTQFDTKYDAFCMMQECSIVLQIM